MTGTGSAGGPSALDALLREMVRRGASDLHLSAGQPPRLRIDGSLAHGGEGGWPGRTPRDWRNPC